LTSKYTYLLFLIAALWLGACESDISGVAQSTSEKLNWPSDGLSAGEYKAWVMDESHGFTRRKTLNEFEVMMTYVPSELKAIRELGAECDDMARRKQEAENFSELEFYELTLAIPSFKDEAIKYGVGDQVEYQNRVQYYGFHAHDDALLICGKDSITCPIHTWERTYNATNKVVLEFAFPAATLQNKKEEPREIIFNERIFGCGPIHFRF
jgi:hypothetical protein